MPPRTLRDLRHSLGLMSQDVAKALGCQKTIVDKRFDKGQFAPNHPLVPKLATVFKMTEGEIKTFAKLPEMDAKQLKGALARLGKPGPLSKGWKGNKPRTWSQRRKERHLAKKEPGTALVHVKRAALTNGKRAYNTLRSLDKDTRQCARSLAMATTLAAMNGEDHLDVAVPTTGLANLLNDYFRLKGIPGPVVVIVDYSEVFG